MNAQTCIANYINGNFRHAEEQAKGIPQRDIFDAAILAGKPHHIAILISHCLKHPSPQFWQYLRQHEMEARS